MLTATIDKSQTKLHRAGKFEMVWSGKDANGNTTTFERGYVEVIQQIIVEPLSGANIGCWSSSNSNTSNYDYNSAFYANADNYVSRNDSYVYAWRYWDRDTDSDSDSGIAKQIDSDPARTNYTTGINHTFFAVRYNQLPQTLLDSGEYAVDYMFDRCLPYTISYNPSRYSEVATANYHIFDPESLRNSGR